MASSWGRGVFLGLFVLSQTPRAPVARASAVAPEPPVAPADPDSRSVAIAQSEMVHVFDTSPLGATYVNDHTIVRGPDGSWHLFGIFNDEPIGPDTERRFIHAVATEPDPAKWTARAFEAAPPPHRFALEADASIGETHLWAPHVMAADGRYVMVYQGGGTDGDRASIRLAESDDLYRWTRTGDTPIFEDICVARDPMLTREGDLWALYYTRCVSTERRVSGVAVRVSRDLARWSEPRMALVLGETPPMANSGYTESPFVLERGAHRFLSVSAYPIAWDATLVYRSRAPFAFPSEPITRLRSHAGEWIAHGSRLFLTHAGAGQRGVWVSEVQGMGEIADPN
jgi:hypothetical protein